MFQSQNDVAATVSADLKKPEAGKFFSPLYLAFFLLLYVFLPSFILSVFLLLRVGSPVFAFWCSHALLLVVAFCMRREITWRDGVVFLVVVAVAYAASWWFFDIFHDGLAYHQPAARRIADGFNPAYDGYMDFGRAPDVWSDNATYSPKAMTYFVACLAKALGDLQFGKAFNILLFVSSLFYTAYAVRDETLVKKCVWFLACLNPIVLTQWTSFLVDGALASLSLMGLLFANAFFTRRTVSGVEYALGVMALSLLFCVKTSGFAYGSIIIFFICLHRLCCVYKESEDRKRRLYEALRKSFRLGLRLGGMVLLVSAVIGFNPYLTNLREGRHIFYPLIRYSRTEEMRTAAVLDNIADVVYPSAHNRFTRALFSIMSHPEVGFVPARMKNPFNAPLSDWLMFNNNLSALLHTGGLGPLFGLLLCVAVLIQILLRGRGNFWLLLTLLLMTFIQPHVWMLRYSPFIWLIPFACLTSVSGKREIFLTIPLLIAVINVGGILFFFCRSQWGYNQGMGKDFEAHRGEVVFLDQSIFEFDGILDRFDLRQKYVNPEEVLFYRFPAVGRLAKNRTPIGVNFFFSEDLLPLPEFPLNLSRDDALPWLRMSEGLAPVEEYREGRPVTVWRSYGNRIKFFMNVDRQPASDWRLTLRGRAYSERGSRSGSLNVVVFVNNHSPGVWKVDHMGTREQSFVIPRSLLEESFEDDGHLLTLMLRMPAVSSSTLSVYETSSFGLELESVEFQPCSRDVEDVNNVSESK